MCARNFASFSHQFKTRFAQNCSFIWNKYFFAQNSGWIHKKYHNFCMILSINTKISSICFMKYCTNRKDLNIRTVECEFLPAVRPLLNYLSNFYFEPPPFLNLATGRERPSWLNGFWATRKIIYLITTSNILYILNILFLKGRLLSQKRIQEFVQGGGLHFFLFPLGPENPLKSKDVTSPVGLSPQSPPPWIRLCS